jgi:hypothetical protein
VRSSAAEGVRPSACLLSGIGNSWDRCSVGGLGAAVLPGVFLLGEFTFAALVRNTLENLVLLRQMQPIRGYYRTLVPEAEE